MFPLLKYSIHINGEPNPNLFHIKKNNSTILNRHKNIYYICNPLLTIKTLLRKLSSIQHSYASGPIPQLYCKPDSEHIKQFPCCVSRV